MKACQSFSSRFKKKIKIYASENRDGSALEENLQIYQKLQQVKHGIRWY
jgi:hypothetical protein